MTRLLLLTGALALAACQPSTAPAQPKADAAGAAAQPAGDLPGCHMQVERPWTEQPAPTGKLSIEGAVVGPSCQRGAVLLTIRQGDGEPVYVWAGVARDLFGLQDASDPVAMKKALGDWVDPKGSTLQTTADLPPWELTGGQTKAAEFPFMPAEGLDKESWDGLRREKAPVYCFPQGQESLSCVKLVQPLDGMPAAAEEIGLQLFPG